MSAGRVTVKRLIGLASQVCALTVDEIMGPKRERRFIRARMAIVHYAIDAGFNLSDIGRRLGNREHNTIMNLRDKAKVWRGRDPLFDRIMDAMAKGIAEGKASQPIEVFKLPQPKPKVKLPVDPLDRADLVQRRAMQAASDSFLRALRQAA